MRLFTGKLGQSIRRPPLWRAGDQLQPRNGPCEAEEPSQRQSAYSSSLKSNAELLHEATDHARVPSAGFKGPVLCWSSLKLGHTSDPCWPPQCPQPCSPSPPAKLSFSQPHPAVSNLIPPGAGTGFPQEGSASFPSRELPPGSEHATGP